MYTYRNLFNVFIYFATFCRSGWRISFDVTTQNNTFQLYLLAPLLRLHRRHGMLLANAGRHIFLEQLAQPDNFLAGGGQIALQRLFVLASQFDFALAFLLGRRNGNGAAFELVTRPVRFPRSVHHTYHILLQQLQLVVLQLRHLVHESIDLGRHIGTAQHHRVRRHAATVAAVVAAIARRRFATGLVQAHRTRFRRCLRGRHRFQAGVAVDVRRTGFVILENCATKRLDGRE